MHPPQRQWNRQVFLSLFRLIAPVRQPLPLVLGLILVVQLLQFVWPYLFKEILDCFSHLTPAILPRMYWLIALTFIVGIATSAVIQFRNWKIEIFLSRLEELLPVRAQEKLVELSLGYHEQEKTGDTIVKVQRGTNRCVDLAGSCLYEFFPTIVQTIATSVILMVLNWRIGLVFFPIIPIFVALTVQMNRRLRPLQRRRYKSDETAGGMMAQSVMNIRTVHAFCQEEREVRAHAAIRQDIRSTALQEERIVLSYNFWRDAVINAGRTAVLLFSVQQWMTGAIGIGSLVFFLTLSERAYFSLFHLSRLFDRASEWAEAVIRLTTLLDTEPEVQSAPNALPAPELRGAIAFRDVSYSYHNGSDALQNISFRIDPGKTVALVGPSGGGKTTVVKLLYRFYDPSSGIVELDGHDVRDLTLESFRNQMAIVMQDVEMFDATIRENIAYGTPEATDEAIIWAATMANAHDFVTEMPKGYDTEIGEDGIRLSGGQRQRIGIARAILRRPKILILDEATSSLDSESEHSIQQALARLQELQAGRTTLIIAHRLSTIRQADEILVFENGQLVESGRHPTLLRQNGLYARLHARQMSGLLAVTSS